VANEIDDPFAIAYAMLSPEQIQLSGLSIAPYQNREVSITKGLTKSIDLAEKTMHRLPQAIPIHPGPTRFLASVSDIARCDAVEAICHAADQGEEPLVIMAIGAATNVASALNLRPDLAERIVVWWLGGHTIELGADEYNLAGDLYAAMVLFDSGVPLVQFPALGVTSHLQVSVHALENDLAPVNELGRFLTGLVRDYVTNHFGYHKELWDVAVPAWAVNPAWYFSTVMPTPSITAGLEYESVPGRHPYRYVHYVNRNAVLGDLFAKIARL
jgi:inosine-uridine nucleoside N-ribohydrolase